MSNRLKVVFLMAGFFCAIQSYATLIEDTVYINRGVMMTVDSTNIPYFAFNSTPLFEKENTRLILNIGDTMVLTVVNMDTLAHGFDIKGNIGIATNISALEIAIVSFSYQAEGAHIYYDHSASETFRYMGLGGMIVVKNPNVSASRFYWNMKEHQKSFNEDINQGLTVDWTTYYPDYFTINGNSNPHINTDANARVVGNVGDTIHIYMVNTGQSLHSIHFHGYHAKIIYSSKFPNHNGRLKDTFGIHSMEIIVIEMIPHQIGEYPVHDHNLVAVSGGNFYPNGMFLTTLIE
ncbi:MAG: FtsP/CotA-like multicopper oxidase with cupredoxin domain [Saprospiraceae bacterium]|jgi:FtsP/CotA-like multicopper oxidase with cupredoxin domain